MLDLYLQMTQITFQFDDSFFLFCQSIQTFFRGKCIACNIAAIHFGRFGGLYSLYNYYSFYKFIKKSLIFLHTQTTHLLEKVFLKDHF